MAAATGGGRKVGGRGSGEGAESGSSEEEPYFTFSPTPSPPECYGKREGGREGGKEGGKSGDFVPHS